MSETLRPRSRARPVSRQPDFGAGDRRDVDSLKSAFEKHHREAVGHIVGNVAHEFNNLLAVILGNAEILFDEIADPELRARAEAVMGAAERGALLTERLLAFGRRQALRPENVELHAVLGSLADVLARTLGERIRLEVRSAPGNSAFVDRALLESALLNLVLNARDAMPEGGALTISVEAVSVDGSVEPVSPGAYVAVTVADTGMGMPESVRDRAFDPFFTTKDAGQSSGMGLAMVYGFAKQSGGHVSIDTAVDEGSAIHMLLPAAHAAARQTADKVESRPAGPGCVVLLVEDEPEVRDFVRTQLSALGYEVVEAATGGSALEVLQSDRSIDLLLTDIILPDGMSGFDIVRSARVLRPQLKVLLTTGYAAEDERVLANLADPILKKPYKKQQLADAVASALERAA